MAQQVSAAQKRVAGEGSEIAQGPQSRQRVHQQPASMPHAPHPQEHLQNPIPALVHRPAPPPLPPQMQQLSGVYEMVQGIQQQLRGAGGDVEEVVRRRARTPQEAGAMRELVWMVKRMQ